jgi:hypothetical protein
MRAVLALLLFAATLTVQAQPRVYQQSELDALLAPIALYPDALLSQVLIASTYPDEVREAAAWLRANPNLKGDEAVRAAEPAAWDPSVKTLLAYPDLLARMDESPHWLADLGAAFVAQEPQVMETVQALRRRAQATGFLQSDGYQSVLQDDDYVVVQPAQPYIAYVPWYNPVVVYGPWWHAHRPIAWRPWHPRPPVFVSLHVQKHKPAVDWRHRHVQRVHVRKPIRVGPAPGADPQPRAPGADGAADHPGRAHPGKRAHPRPRLPQGFLPSPNGRASFHPSRRTPLGRPRPRPVPFRGRPGRLKPGCGPDLV